MSEEQGTTSTISDEQIDAIFEEAPSPEGQPSEPSSQSDGLEKRLQTIGLPKEEIQSLLEIEDPEARAVAIIDASTKKTDERMRGIQSGFSQLDNEVKTKAQQLDQLRAMPEFQRFVHQLNASPDTVVEEELDLSKVELSKLPEDGLARFEHLTKLVADKVAGEKTNPLASELAQVKELVGNLIWTNFTERHPDAVSGQSDIARLVGSGYTLDQAYNAWRGMNLDPAQIEEQTLQRVRDRFATKKKASQVPMTTHEGGDLPVSDGQKRAAELVKEKGVRKGFMSLLAERAGDLDL